MSRPFLLAVLALGLLAGCAPSEQESAHLGHAALLRRQNQGIRELIAEEERGSLVPIDRFLIGVDQSVIADLLRSQLPLERPLGKRFIMRLDTASVLLNDKFGAVTIQGYVYRPKTPEHKAVMRIFGGFDSVAVEPGSGTLNFKLVVDHIDLLQADILDGFLGGGSKKSIAELARPIIQNSIPPFRVPVVLGRSFTVPSIAAAGITVDSLNVPLDLSVERVIAAGGRLWVTLNAELGAVTGAEQGLHVTVKKKAGRRMVP